MYSACLILFALAVGSTSAFPVGWPADFPYDNNNDNSYQPCYNSDLCRSLFPNGNAYPQNYPQNNPQNYIAPPAVVGPDFLPPAPNDVAYNYLYGSPKTINYAKENYVRNYGWDSSEVGVRDQVSVRSYAPGIVVPPYSRICSYFPVGNCVRNANVNANRYPPAIPVDYDVAF